MQRLSYPAETVLYIKITKNRIVLPFKDSPGKTLGRRPSVFIEVSYQLQGWAKEWALGCGPAARVQRESEVGFTQPRAYSFSQPCMLPFHCPQRGHYCSILFTDPSYFSVARQVGPPSAAVTNLSALLPNYKGRETKESRLAAFIFLPPTALL